MRAWQLPVWLGICVCFVVVQATSAAAVAADGCVASSRPAAGCSAPASSRPVEGSARSVCSQPAKAAADPAVHEILQRLEKRGGTIHDLSAKIVWEIFDEVLEDTQRKYGQLLFKRGEPYSKFLITFSRTVIEDQVIDKAEEHLFDGRWYIEKREATKSVIKREIVRPGEKLDPFKVGQGPFPLPFGQKEQDILRNFEVALVRTDPKASPDTVHLKLVPKGGQMAQRYREIHFYISRKLDLPVKVVALQKDDKKMTVVFKDIRINRGIAGSRFVVTVPDDPTWSYTVEPLPKQNIKQ